MVTASASTPRSHQPSPDRRLQPVGFTAGSPCRCRPPSGGCEPFFGCDFRFETMCVPASSALSYSTGATGGSARRWVPPRDVRDARSGTLLRSLAAGCPVGSAWCFAEVCAGMSTPATKDSPPASARYWLPIMAAASTASAMNASVGLVCWPLTRTPEK